MIIGDCTIQYIGVVTMFNLYTYSWGFNHPGPTPSGDHWHRAAIVQPMGLEVPQVWILGRSEIPGFKIGVHHDPWLPLNSYSMVSSTNLASFGNPEID